MYKHYDSPEFESRYTYTGTDLGAVWSREKTVFRLWAPTASRVTVNLYASGTAGTDDRIGQLEMQPDIQGTWVAEKSGDLNGIYYTYLVETEGTLQEACDPYARTTGVNGQRAMVLDLSSTNPQGWAEDRDPHAGNAVTDAVIWELHVRDMSMDASSGICHKGTFLGVAETGTHTPGGIPTGLDHAKALGITHIHLLPVYDFGFTDEARPDPQYNWGYDPVNYNVPEGSYSTDPFHGQVRVAEMKQMVKTLHDNGISVIMDVVYNHVYHDQPFCFHQIVPGYFSRIDENGVWSSGSICGNDTASERSMVRKYIVDSVNYWADEYHIDGFRFDLVGLIDVQTINEIVSTVRSKHPNVIFYGEGWDMPTAMTKENCPLAIQANSPLMPGFAFFSDNVRDLLRGSIRDDSAPGYASGAQPDLAELNACFMGMPEWAAQPSQNVSYVSCHDNHTLFDRIALGAPKASFETRVRMNDLAAAFSILSQGIPFMQAGEEMLRTKPDGKGGYDDNSYRSPDSVNALKWSTLEDPVYQKNVRYYRGLLALRKAYPCLRLQTRDAVTQTVTPIPTDDPMTAVFHLEDEQDVLYVIFNAGTKPQILPLPLGSWEVKVFDDLAGTAPLFCAEHSITAAPISATVLTQKKR